MGSGNHRRHDDGFRGDTRRGEVGTKTTYCSGCLEESCCSPIQEGRGLRVGIRRFRSRYVRPQRRTGHLSPTSHLRRTEDFLWMNTESSV